MLTKLEAGEKGLSHIKGNLYPCKLIFSLHQTQAQNKQAYSFSVKFMGRISSKFLCPGLIWHQDETDAVYRHLIEDINKPGYHITVLHYNLGKSKPQGIFPVVCLEERCSSKLLKQNLTTVSESLESSLGHIMWI